MPDDHIEAPSWIGRGVLQGSIGLWYNVFLFSICLKQDFCRSNAVYTLPWPACLPSSNLSSICEGPHWLPYKVTWATSRKHGAVMPGNPGGLGWHPTGMNYSFEPIHVMDMQSSAWETRFVTTIIDLATLNNLLHRAKCCTKQNATINFCLAMDDSRRVADLNHTKQFLWAVFTIIRFPVEINVRFFFCSVYFQMCGEYGPQRSNFWATVGPK